MFNKKVKNHYKKKYGSAIEHGKAHHSEHGKWNRRNFLKMTGLATLGTSMALGPGSVSAFNPSPLLANLAMGDCGDRILVLLRLNGGNDGLNTVIYRNNDEYYNIRPTLAVQEADLWALDDDYGMPNELISLQPFWNEGKMKIIHNVGYPEANYSHFRSSDIWASASDSDEVVSTGWIARYLDQEFPAFMEAPPVIPPALQIGVQTNLLFRGAAGSMALSINNPTEFYQIAQTGQLYDTTQLSEIPKETELKYIRTVANSSFRYAETIRDAYNSGNNQTTYSDHYLSEEMSIVARLIKGNLGTKVYMVSIGGFDTHANQLDGHPGLLTAIGQAVSSFFSDLTASGHAQNVLVMSFSEFGRTIFENGSAGTDHGTGAPMIVVSGDDSMGNGFIGTPMDLVNTDIYGDPIFDTDFRSAYATILQNWMCADPATINHVLGNDFDRLDDLLPSATPPVGSNDKAALLGHNPAKSTPGTIEIKYAIKAKGMVRLQLLDTAGHPLRTLVSDFRERGSYTLSFRPTDLFLPPGEYRYRLDTGGKVYGRKIRW